MTYTIVHDGIATIMVDSDSFSYATEVDATLPYGTSTMCAGATLHADDGALLMTADDFCKSMWTGPEIREWESRISDNGDNILNVSASAGHWSDEFNDVTMHWTVTDDADNAILDQGSELFMDESSVSANALIDIPGEGEYCLSIELVENGEAEPFDTHRTCMTVEDGPQVSERMEKIGGALAEVKP